MSARGAARVRGAVAAARRRAAHDDSGMTLVELVVAMAVSLVVLALALEGVHSYVVDTRRQQDRVEALTEVQLAAQAMTRDLRAARPVVTFSSLACEAARAPVTTCSNDLTVQLERAGSVVRIRYALVPDATGTRLDRTACTMSGTTCGSPTTVTLLRGLRNGVSPAAPVFALTTARGANVPGTTVAEGIAGLERIQLTLVKNVGAATAPALRVETEAAVRNAVYQRAFR